MPFSLNFGKSKPSTISQVSVEEQSPQLVSEYPPPPTSESPPPSSEYEKPIRAHRASWVDVSRGFLAILLLGAGAAIVGCESHVLYAYNSTHLSAEWFLPLWPQNLDLRPTLWLLVAGAVITTQGLFNLVCVAVPKLRTRPTLQTLVLVTSSVIGVAASILAAAFSGRIYAHLNPSGRDTLESWSCRWNKGVSANVLAQATGTSTANTSSSSTTAPQGFDRVCWESHAAFDVMVVAVAFEALAVGMAVMGWWVARRRS